MPDLLPRRAGAEAGTWPKTNRNPARVASPTAFGSRVVDKPIAEFRSVRIPCESKVQQAADVPALVGTESTM